MDPKLTHRYQSAQGAAAYRRKYERSWARRLSHARELHVVRAALGRAQVQGTLLDVPCGAGRLLPTLLASAPEVVAADLSEAMVREAKDALAAHPKAGSLRFVVASAADLPLGDGEVDTAVCHRLLHHMADASERAAVLAELARVARRRVLLSFSDDTTLKSTLQRRRGIVRNRHVLTPQALFDEAAPHGLKPLGAPLRLCGWTSLVAVAVFAREGTRA